MPLQIAVVAVEGSRKQELGLRNLLQPYRAWAQLHRVAPHTSILEMPTVGHLSPLTFARAFAADQLPCANEFLYLDADILVVSDLSTWPSPGNAIALAAENSPRRKLGDRDVLFYASKEPGFGAELHLRNPGICVVNALQWRAEGIAEKVVSFARRYETQLRYADQDAINVICGKRLGDLPCEWNCQHPNAGVPQGARVIHFTGTMKPWNSGFRSPAVKAWIAEASRVLGVIGVNATRWRLRRLVRAAKTSVEARMRG